MYYTMTQKSKMPIAIIEAKDNKHYVGAGMPTRVRLC